MKNGNISKSRPKRVSTALGRPSSRDRILDTAIDQILEHGVESLTFEGIAKAAGLTKGGILYNFPTRDELYLAIRQRVRERYHEARKETMKSLPDGPSRELKAWVLAGLNNRSKLDAVSSKIMASGLWANEDDKAQYRERFGEISAGVGFDRSALVYLATEGLWFLEIAKFSPFSQEQRQHIVSMLLNATDSAGLETET